MWRTTSTGEAAPLFTEVAERAWRQYVIMCCEDGCGAKLGSGTSCALFDANRVRCSWTTTLHYATLYLREAAKQETPRL